MSKHSLIYFILSIFLQVLVEVNCQMTPFKPSVQYQHTATYVDNKLYILAGRDFNKILIKEFFYLDVSVPFDTQELSWHDLSNINMLPLHDAATSAKGGANNDTLFLYGGVTNDQTMALVYTFDPQHIIWNPQKITGINTIRKWSLTGVISNNGIFYLWGGAIEGGYINEMFILNTINLNWGKGSSLNAPIPRSHYGAVLLPNNKIIYIGGTNYMYDPNIVQSVALTLSEVYIYDIINDKWNTEITSGKIPSNRAGFRAILGLDGQRIIIYGGKFDNPGYSDSSLYVLDLTNYNWYIPKISGKIPNPRAYHKANVIGNYMVISFGQGYDRKVESDILLLDISNNEKYIWTTNFYPSVPKNIIPSPPPPSPSPSLSSSSNNMAGAIVGSLLGGMFLSAAGSFFIYKWNKNKQKLKTNYGDENNNNYNQEKKELPTVKDIHNYEHAFNNNEQEINQIPRNKNMTNYEQIIIPANDYHGQENMQTFKNKNTTNHELIIPASEAVINSNYNYGQEVISKSNNNRLSSQILTNNDILQAIKQEIGQNLKNEILQAIREENYNDLNNTKNNTRKD